MKMFRHDNEGMQEELSLTAIVEDGMLQQLRCSRDLKKVMALGRHSGNKVSSGFLSSETHLNSINERPVAKATYFASLYSGA